MNVLLQNRAKQNLTSLKRPERGNGKKRDKNGREKKSANMLFTVLLFSVTGSGMGAFAVANYSKGDTICDYWGHISVAVSEKDKSFSENMYWGMHTRAVEFECQPVVVDNLRVQISLVGSFNCVGSYFNTMYQDTQLLTDVPLYPFYLQKFPEYMLDTSKLFNCEFRWKEAFGYNAKTRTFANMNSFKKWLASNPLVIVATRDIVEGEEFFIPYFRM